MDADGDALDGGGDELSTRVADGVGLAEGVAIGVGVGEGVRVEADGLGGAEARLGEAEGNVAVADGEGLSTVTSFGLSERTEIVPLPPAEGLFTTISCRLSCDANTLDACWSILTDDFSTGAVVSHGCGALAGQTEPMREMLNVYVPSGSRVTYSMLFATGIGVAIRGDRLEPALDRAANGP